MFVRMTGQGPRVGAAASAAVGGNDFVGGGIHPFSGKMVGPCRP
jgi:hypothetical protein